MRHRVSRDYIIRMIFFSFSNRPRAYTAFYRIYRELFPFFTPFPRIIPRTRYHPRHESLTADCARALYTHCKMLSTGSHITTRRQMLFFSKRSLRTYDIISTFLQNEIRFYIFFINAIIDGRREISRGKIDRLVNLSSSKLVAYDWSTKMKKMQLFILIFINPNLYKKLNV